jgi:hypothetical protein
VEALIVRGRPDVIATTAAFMTVVLLDDDAGGEPDQCLVVGEDPDDVGAAADLAVERLERVGLPQLCPVVSREAGERE